MSGNFPPPVTLDQLGARILAQERAGTEKVHDAMIMIDLVSINPRLGLSVLLEDEAMCAWDEVMCCELWWNRMK